MKTVVILGASGFVGKYLTEHLQNFNIVPVTRSDLNLGDFFAVEQFLSTVRPYAVINCAMPGTPNKIDNLDSDDIREIVRIFLNFYNLSHLFTKYINIGSGAEFDRDTNINNANEFGILNVTPKDNYGYVKNVISRLCLNHEKFYTLRLFGCFDTSENDLRLFARLMREEPISILDDREFDFFSAEDFCTVVSYYLNNRVVFRDVNCVYSDKQLLSTILNKFIEIHDLNTTAIIVGKTKGYNYTGAAGRLFAMNIPLVGLEKSIEKYK